MVDDDEGNRELLTRILERKGHEVASARDGQEALDLIRERRPNVILLDLMLPGTDGLNICRQVRKDPESAHTAVMIITAEGDEKVVQQGMALGADDYLLKPFDVAEVESRVSALLKKYETK